MACYQNPIAPLVLVIRHGQGSTSVGSSIERTAQSAEWVHRSRCKRTTTRSLRIFCRHSTRCWRLIGGVLGGAAFVVMMQTAHFTNLHHSTLGWRLYSSGLRCVFAERQVSSPPMVISAVRGECPMQRAFAVHLVDEVLAENLVTVAQQITSASSCVV